MMRIVHGKLRCSGLDQRIPHEVGECTHPTTGISSLVMIGNTVPPYDEPVAMTPKAVARFFLNQWLATGNAPPKMNPQANPVAKPCARRNCQNWWHSATRKVAITRRQDADASMGWKKPISKSRPESNPGTKTKAYCMEPIQALMQFQHRKAYHP